jgi:predicted nucleotidyltransferase
MTRIETMLHRLKEGQVEFVIVGGVAAVLHGASVVTDDLDVCYARHRENLERIVQAIAPLHPTLRGAPSDLPFLWDSYTLRNGLNFTLQTDLGSLDLLGEVAGVGTFEQAHADAVLVQVFGIECLVLSLKQLIAAKKAAGRSKDLMVLPELEALLQVRPR